MVVVKHVRICNFPEYQPNSVGIVALKICAYSVWDLLAWGDDAQVNLLSLLHQCIEIGISISESFYRAVRTYEAPFGEGLARVLEQDSSGKGLIRSVLGDYFVRRYPRALIEMHVLSREFNGSRCGIRTFLGGLRVILGNLDLLPHAVVLLPSNPRQRTVENCEQGGVEHDPPVNRRFVTLWCAFGIYIFFGWLGSRLICAGWNRLGCAVGNFGVGLIIAATVLIFLTGFRWTWGWWW